MGLLKDINDIIWKPLLKFTSYVTDNVYIDIFIISSIFIVLWFVCKIIFEKRTRLSISPFGPFSMITVLSVGHMVNRLPMLHERLQTALNTTVNVIRSSSIYLENFSQAANLIPEKSSDIASFLYFMTHTDRVHWECAPKELYTPLFNTLDNIRGFLFFPDAHLSSFATASVFFAITILFIVMMGVIKIEKKNDKYDKIQVIIYLLQAIFLLYTTIINNAATICAMFLWFTQEIIHGMFGKDNCD